MRRRECIVRSLSCKGKGIPRVLRGHADLSRFVKPEAEVTTPRHIAEKAWELCVQKKGSFDLDVDIVDPEYKERRKKELAAQQQQK